VLALMRGAARRDADDQIVQLNDMGIHVGADAQRSAANRCEPRPAASWASARVGSSPRRDSSSSRLPVILRRRRRRRLPKLLQLAQDRVTIWVHAMATTRVGEFVN
jgi:hypothetical protein